MAWFGGTLLVVLGCFLGIFPSSVAMLCYVSTGLCGLVILPAMAFDRWGDWNKLRNKYHQPPERNPTRKGRARRSKTFRGPKKNVVRDVVAQAATPPEDIETRLRRIENLHNNGLLTDAEYQAKREEILGEV